MASSKKATAARRARIGQYGSKAPVGTLIPGDTVKRSDGSVVRLTAIELSHVIAIDLLAPNATTRVFLAPSEMVDIVAKYEVRYLSSFDGKKGV